MAGNQQFTPRLNNLEPNLVIDGGMEIWPEGTSRSIINNAEAYGAVLFKVGNDSSGITLTNSQQASIPSLTNIPFSSQVSKTAAGTLAAATRIRYRYFVEGYDTNKILNQDFSVLFFVKSSVAATRSLAVTNGTSITHSYVQQYSIASANTWQLQVLKIPALSSCPGTVDRTNGFGLQVQFNIVSGSTFQTGTLNSWTAGNFSSGMGEDTTWLTGTTHDFSIAGVMILPGDWTSLTSNPASYNFLRAGRNFQEETSMSQRYYEKSYDPGVSPGAVSDPGAIIDFSGSESGSNASYSQVEFKVEKRANPTKRVFTTSGSADAVLRFINAGGSVIVGVVGFSGFSGVTGFAFDPGGATAGDRVIFRYHFTADARF